MAQCDACPNTISAGNSIELEYPQGDEPVLVAGSLCERCASTLANHPILERVRVTVEVADAQ